MRSKLTKKLRSSISFRIALLFSLTFSVALVLAFTVSYFEMDFSLAKSSRELISAKHRETAAILIAKDVRGLKDFLSDKTNRARNAPFFIRVLNPSGETVYFKPSVQEERFDFDPIFRKVESLDRHTGWNSLNAIDDEDEFSFLTEKAGERYYLQIGRSNEDYREILERMVDVFLLTGGLFILAGTALGFWYARRSLKPLRALLATIKTIEKGDLSKRVEIDGPQDELHDLGDTFNRMIGRIETLVRVMRESLDNVAHDIRTPLTRIRVVAEDALTSDNPTPLKEALQDCAENAADVSALVDQLLSISEAEAGAMQLKRTECKVATLIAEVVEIYEFVAEDKSIKITVNCEPNLTWVLDRKRIKQAIANLLENAIKYSNANSTTEISAHVVGDTIQLSVLDQGIGVPESDISRIWDRLYRVDKARTTQGLGLGLSIVRSIALAHGGLARARRTDPGMIFTIELPRADEVIHA